MGGKTPKQNTPNYQQPITDIEIAKPFVDAMPPPRVNSQLEAFQAL